jgi:hypothetical protein
MKAQRSGMPHQFGLKEYLGSKAPWFLYRHFFLPIAGIIWGRIYFVKIMVEYGIKSGMILISIHNGYHGFVTETGPKLEPGWTISKSVTKIHKSS